ncbi:hypothetical protein PIB30_011793 [Stylosanthes scabra]|uniref:Uncharacterized protein n=1 Tax=Stylosanthes scabra TaxID=79078 RepID=A0ABU6R6B2_9FABA|nr:hypothetical protein [Stylosanthes scabra]
MELCMEAGIIFKNVEKIAIERKIADMEWRASHIALGRDAIGQGHRQSIHLNKWLNNKDRLCRIDRRNGDELNGLIMAANIAPLQQQNMTSLTFVLDFRQGVTAIAVAACFNVVASSKSG